MRIVLAGLKTEHKETLDVLIELLMHKNKPEVSIIPKTPSFLQDNIDTIVICPEYVSPEEKENLRKNNIFPVIMLTGKEESEMIKNYNVYRTVKEIKDDIVPLIKEAFSAKSVIDAALGTLPSRHELDDILKKEIVEIKAAENKTVSKFEALYLLLQRDPARIKVKKLPDMRIGLIGQDYSKYTEIERKLKEVAKKRNKKLKFEFNNIIKAHTVRDEELDQYDLIISEHLLESQKFIENCKVPIILLNTDTSTKERFVREHNIQDLFPAREIDKIVDAAWFALLQKLEIDRLKQRFPDIAKILNTKERIDQEQYFVKTGDHGRSAEEGEIYCVRGRARQVSRFEAAHLIAMEELMKIEKAKGDKDDRQIADLFSFYYNLYLETENSDYGRKGLRIWKQSKRKLMEDWLVDVIDIIKDNPQLSAKLIARYYTKHPMGVMEHKHRLIAVTRLAISVPDKRSRDGNDRQVQLQIKYSPPEGKRWLMIEEKILAEYNKINEEISNALGLFPEKSYVYLPEYISSYFPPEDAVTKPDENDFLIFERVPGPTACQQVNLVYNKEIDVTVSEEEKNKIIEKKDDLARKVIRENSKINAMGYIIKKRHPTWFEKVHADDDYNKRKEHYLERINNRFIGHENLKDKIQEKENLDENQERFKGGIWSLLAPERAERVEEIRRIIIDNIDPVLDIIMNMREGVFTDRSLRNSVINGELIYEVDFEKLRNMPTVFDIASTLELGFSSNERNYVANEDIFLMNSIVYPRGSTISKTQRWIVEYANCIHEELQKVSKIVDFSQEEITEIMKNIIPDFKQYEKEYYASAILTNMTGSGTFVRLLYQPESQIDDNEQDKELKAKLKEESERGAHRCFTNLYATALELKRFYQDSKNMEKLDNLANLFYTAGLEIEEKLKEKLEAMLKVK